MNHETIDWTLIEKHLAELEHKPLLPSFREACKQAIKDAFAEGRMVAGTTFAGYVMGDKQKRISCALGQLDAAHIPWVQLDLPVSILTTINNYACTHDGEIPDAVLLAGMPFNGGGHRSGEPLVRIEPLLELFDRL
jgi:hypothetical protein